MSRVSVFSLLFLFLLAADSPGQTGFAADAKISYSDPWYPYKTVYQLGEAVALRYVLGEVYAPGSGELVRWNSWIDTLPNIRPVFRFNAPEIQDSVLTQPFTVRAGDTLHYFTLFETYLNDRLEISGYRIPDRVTFTLELLRFPDNSLVASVDTLVVEPADSVRQFMENHLRHLLTRIDKAEFRHSFPVPDAAGSGVRVRMHLRPEYHGPVERREMLVTDKWYPSLYRQIIEGKTIYTQLFDSARVHALARVNSSSGGAGVETPGRGDRIWTEHFPSPARDNLSIHFSIPTAAPVTISLFDNTGRLVSLKELGPVPCGKYGLDLPVGGLPSGTYYYTIHADGAYTSAKIQIAR